MKFLSSQENSVMIERVGLVDCLYCKYHCSEKELREGYQSVVLLISSDDGSKDLVEIDGKTYCDVSEFDFPSKVEVTASKINLLSRNSPMFQIWNNKYVRIDELVEKLGTGKVLRLIKFPETIWDQNGYGYYSVEDARKLHLRIMKRDVVETTKGFTS